MLQPRVKEEVTYVSNCLGLSCIIWAASLFRGSSGLGSCSHTALQLGLSGQHRPSQPPCLALLWPALADAGILTKNRHVTSSQAHCSCHPLWLAAAGTSTCRHPSLKNCMTHPGHHIICSNALPIFQQCFSMALHACTEARQGTPTRNRYCKP